MISKYSVMQTLKGNNFLLIEKVYSIFLEHG